MSNKPEMPKYGVMSIPHRFDIANFESFDHFYQGIGLNTGNLLFSTAVWRQLGGKKTRIAFMFDPDHANENFDAIIIPAANWVNQDLDLGDIADRLEKLRIPVIVIGLGAQQYGSNTKINIKPGTRRFLKAVADRSTSFSVRGEFTGRVLARLGFNTFRVTGCPSLYSHYRNFKEFSRPEFELEKCLLHSTRFSASNAGFVENPSANLDIFRFAYRKRLDLLLQSEPEELGHLSGFTALEQQSEILQSTLLKIYQSQTLGNLQHYLEKHGKLFINISTWAEAVQDYCLCFGTRLHGSILALNSGRPAVLVWHDSRTRELAEFAAIPTIAADKLQLSAKAIEAAYELADYDLYFRRRDENRTVYQDFLRENNLLVRST